MYPYPESKRTTQKYWETATSIDLYFIPYIYMWNIYIYMHTHIYIHTYTHTYTCRKPWFYSWVRKIPWRRDRLPTSVFMGFPGVSDSKGSTCNVEDLGSIPGLGCHGGRHALEEGMATHSSILVWRTPMDRGAFRATVHGVAKSWTRLSD